jgi:probable F420-dependent oxidoreductase
MKIGISLLRANPRFWPDISVEAEHLGFESVWIGEHLVVPDEIDRSGYPDGELPISSSTPIFDAFVMLADIAARTTVLRVGTYVYQLGLRHPFVSLRAINTLDHISGGRLELGVGVGWLREEWEAAGFDFADRGKLLDETLEICLRAWADGSISHAGTFYQFPSTTFAPVPAPPPRIHVGGESDAALRRAVRVGQGWIGMHHDAISVIEPMRRLRAVAKAAEAGPLETTVAAAAGEDIDLDAWRGTGIDRLLVAPWGRSADAIPGMRRLANRLE